MIYLQLLTILLLAVVICQRGIKLSTLKRLEKQMSALSESVAKIGEDVGEIQTAVQRVLDLLLQPDPDVAGAVAALENADAAFDAVRDSLNAAGKKPE